MSPRDPDVISNTILNLYLVKNNIFFRKNKLFRKIQELVVIIDIYESAL